MNDRTNEGKAKPIEKNKRRIGLNLGQDKQMTGQTNDKTNEGKDHRGKGQTKDRKNEIQDKKVQANGRKGQTIDRTNEGQDKSKAGQLQGRTKRRARKTKDGTSAGHEKPSGCTVKGITNSYFQLN